MRKQERSIENILLFLFLAFYSFTAFGCSKSNSIAPEDKGEDVKQTSVNVLNFKNGSKNDLDMIQKAVDYASAKKIFEVIIPDGNYLISAASSTGEPGLLLRDNIQLKMSGNAVLKAIPNNVGNYSIIRIHNVSNVSITGGRIVGERNEHTGTTGEWGMGIDIRNSKQVDIIGVVVSDCWGDGIYIAGGSKSVKIDNVLCDNNRRQGMSVINTDDLIVKNSRFINTKGAAPEAGIDLEPNESDKVTNVQIIDCVFENNAGLGLHMYGKFGPVTNISVKNCTMNNNPIGLSLRYEGVNTVEIENIEVRNSVTDGFRVFDGSHSVKVKGLRVLDSESNATRFENTKNLDLQQLTVTRFATGSLINNSSNIAITKSTFIPSNKSATHIQLNNSKEVKLSEISIEGGLVGLKGNVVDILELKNSVIKSIDETAVQFTSLQNSVFEYNQFTSNPKNTIILAKSKVNQIRNNEFLNNGSFAKDSYVILNLIDGSTGNVISSNVSKPATVTNLPVYIVKMDASTLDNQTLTNQFDISSFSIAAIKDDTNGGNKIQ